MPKIPSKVSPCLVHMYRTLSLHSISDQLCKKDHLQCFGQIKFFTLQDCHVITDPIGTFGAGVSCSAAKL